MRSNTPPDGTSSLSERSAASRERILNAATAEFAEQGLGGARVDMIAERAGINKRMLYQYVGNKESLWVAALERVYEIMRTGEQALRLDTLDPLEGMEKLIRYKFRLHQEHPEFISILNEENRQKGINLDRSSMVPSMYSPLLTMLQGLLTRGAALKIFRADVDAMRFYISIAGLSYFYCSNHYTLSTIFGQDLGKDAAMRKQEDHVVEVVLGYLRP